MKKYWTNGGFRVWLDRGDGILEYQSDVICSDLGSDWLTLTARMPGGAWLREWHFPTLELHYDTCGVPMEYRPERVMFRATDCEPGDWWIEPLGNFSSLDGAVVEVHVMYHCERISGAESFGE